MSNEANDQKGQESAQSAAAGTGAKHLVFINEVPHEVDAQSLTGAQIKGLAGVPSDYQLFLEQPGDDKQIADGETVKLHNNMKFYTLPPATFG